MSYVLKTIFFTFYLLLLYILVFSCIFYNSTITTVTFKSFVEVYPIEAYLIGKGVVEISGCSPPFPKVLIYALKISATDR